MGRVALAYTLQLESCECAACGTVFGMNPHLERQLRQSHATFYCPAGHSNYFPGESEAERVKRLLKEEEARHARTLARENTERMEKEKLARKLKRVGRGVCPDCNRSFTNLARHMCSQHGNGDQGRVGKAQLP
jgi:hypothetical protein